MIAVLARLVAAMVLLAAVGMVLWPSSDAVVTALARAGWPAVALMAVLHVLPVALCGLAWARQMPGRGAMPFVQLRWIRDGFNELLALLPLAGEVAALRLLVLKGVAPGLAGAGMVVDLTAEVAAQVIFSLIGLALWAQWPGAEPVVRWGVAGGVAALAMVAAFVAAQHGGGLRLVDILAARFLPMGLDLHAQVLALYRRRGRLAAAMLLHLAAWLAACLEAWAALALLGHPLPLAQVVMLESAVFALRSAAFAVPGALGVQEGAYGLLAPLLGVPPVVAVTLALLKRGREIALGLPAVAAGIGLSRRRLPGGRAASPSSDRR